MFFLDRVPLLLSLFLYFIPPNPEPGFKGYADYLIIEYIDMHGGIVIKNIWLKKIWESCCASERSPLKTQVKQGFPYNIRPATFYSKRAKYKPFQSRHEFVLALKSLIDTVPNMNNIQKDWYKKVRLLYKQQTKNDL